MTAVAAPASPFKGLAPFGDSDLDALFFFGRTRETEVIAANLEASRLTVLFGPSGVGKSSVLRAGVAHRLRRESDAAVEIVDSWAADAAASVLAALAARPEDGDLYLILDQFEEYFLYHPDDAEVPGLLADVVAERGLRVNVLIGIRDDSLARLDTFRRPIPNLLANRLRLDRLDRDAARAAIVGPVDRYNGLTGEKVEVEPALVETALDEVATGRVDLGRAGRGGVDGQEIGEGIEAPYLQLVLERLWDAEREEGSRRLRLETLRRLGGAARIVHDHLEHAMAELTPAEKEAAAAMYNHLVTPSGTKIAHGIGDLAGYASVPEPEAARVLSKLVQERIVRASSHDGAAATRYEIFHDVLADAVLAWRARHEEARALGRAHEQRRRARRVAGAAFVGLLVVAAIAVYALIERGTASSQADRARARELAANALGAIDTDPAASVRLAYDAAKLERASHEEDVLRKSLAADRLRRTLHAGAPVTVVAFDESGRHVLAASRDGKVRIEPGIVLDHGAPVAVAAFGSDARRVVSGGDDGFIRIWDAASGTQIARREAGGVVRSVAFARRGRILITATANGRIKVWRSTDWQLLQSLRLALDDVVRVTVDPAATRIAVVARDKFLRVFAVSSGDLVRTLAHDGFVGDAVFSPGGRLLATSDYVGNVRIWRADNLRLVRKLAGGQLNIGDLEWSPDGSKLAAGSADGTARVWVVATGLQMAIMLHAEEVTSVAFSPDGTHLVTVAGKSARIWGATPDRAGRSISVLAGHTAPITAAVYNPEGRTVVTGSLDGTARIWDPGSELELQARVRQTAALTSLVASKDGRRVVVGDAKGVIHFWAPSGRAIEPPVHVRGAVNDLALGQNKLEAAVGPTTAVAISVDGRRTARAVGDTLRIRLAPGARIEMRRVRGGPIHDLAFSPNGQLLAIALEDGTAQLWDLEARGPARTLRGHHLPVLSVAFSHDGHLLATASQDKDARIWSVASGAKVRLLHGHFGPVRTVTFSPDDRWIVTAGPTTAIDWRTTTGEFGFLRGPTTELLTGAVWAGRDGRTVVTSSKEGTLRTFHCDLCGDLDDLMAVAKRRLARR